jgi:hypothetical protein
MAKKKFDPSSSTQLDGLGTFNQKADKNNRSTAEVKRVARVTGKSKNADAKGRLPKTIRLPPALISDVDKIANEEGYSKMDFWHWLVEMGLDDYNRGERPEVADTEVRRTINI